MFDALRYWKPILWFILCALTLQFAVYPLKLELQYGSVQPLQVIENPAIFSVLFLAWITILFILLFYTKNESLRLLLLVIFGLIFLGFWMIRVPNGTNHDEYMNMGITNYIMEHGLSSEREYFNLYLDYPLVHIFGAEISYIWGHSITEASRVFLPFLTVFFILELYIFFRSVLNNRDGAVLSTVFAVLGNLLWARFQAFAPFELGHVLLMAFLISFVRRRYKVTFIVWPALVIAYLPTSTLVLLVLLGIGIFEKLSIGNLSRARGQLLYCSLVFFIWNLFWSYRTYANTLEYIIHFFPFGMSDFSWASETLGVISNVPLWVNLVEYFWAAFLLGLGLIIGLRKLFALRKSEAETNLILGGLLGTLAFGLASAIVVPGGLQWSRIFYYGPIFSAPLVAGFVIIKARRRTMLAMLAIVLIILSFPTFLVQARSVSCNVVYDYERSLGSFISNHVGPDVPRIVADPATSAALQYYVPQAQFSTPSSYNLKDMRDVFDTNFQGLEMLTRKSQAILYFYFGENATNAYLRDITNAAFQGQKVYDSGWTQIYSKP